MIWLTWRQFRGAAVSTAVVLGLLVVVLALTGPDLASRYSTGIAACAVDGGCDRFFDLFFDEFQSQFTLVSLLVLALPALMGLFWGAPLIARELEAGTHLLVWSQGVTRGRWLVVKLGLVGLAAVAAAGVLGLAVTWWAEPLDLSATPDLGLMTPLVFGARGIVPMGYAAFAFVLGVSVGTLARRTLPAMALTLAVFAVVQVAVPMLVRPHLAAPVTATFPLDRANVESINVQRDGGGQVRIGVRAAVSGQPGAWVLSSGLVDPSGKVLSADEEPAPVTASGTSGPCAPQAAPAHDSCLTEINALGYRQLVSYHPLDRFWPFQWMETAIYAVLTLGLTWFSFWWIRRRLS
ncbi:ABC transporter permease subunit [Herbidospora sp. RD11066]